MAVSQDSPDALAAAQHRQVALVGKHDRLGTAMRPDHHGIGVGAARAKASQKRGELCPRLACGKDLIDTWTHGYIIAERCTRMDTPKY